MARPYKIHSLDSLKSRCDEVGDCWLWNGANDGHGKPSMRYMGGVVSPRRIARELKDGKPIPEGKQVVPTCGERRCISPHCSIITDHKGRAAIASKYGAFNNPSKIRRMALKRREDSWITDAMVNAIRCAANAPEASRQTGVSLSHCKAIRNGSARKDYSNPFAGLMASNDSRKAA